MEDQHQIETGDQFQIDFEEKQRQSIKIYHRDHGDFWTASYDVLVPYYIPHAIMENKMVCTLPNFPHFDNLLLHCGEPWTEKEYKKLFAEKRSDDKWYWIADCRFNARYSFLELLGIYIQRQKRDILNETGDIREYLDMFNLCQICKKNVYLTRVLSRFSHRTSDVLCTCEKCCIKIV